MVDWQMPRVVAKTNKGFKYHFEHCVHYYILPFSPLALFFFPQLLWTAVVGSPIHFQLPSYEFHHTFELVQLTWSLVRSELMIPNPPIIVQELVG
jgi:hypothetical protein